MGRARLWDTARQSRNQMTDVSAWSKATDALDSSTGLLKNLAKNKNLQTCLQKTSC
jgi:hypothetical protein